MEIFLKISILKWQLTKVKRFQVVGFYKARVVRGTAYFNSPFHLKRLSQPSQANKTKYVNRIIDKASQVLTPIHLRFL